MTAGLPGTGIGGLFYMLMVVLMPFRELGMVVRGRSTWARWRLIAKSVGILTAVIAGLCGEGWLLKKLFEFFHMALPGSTLANGSVSAMNFVLPAVALMPFIVLGGIYSAMHILRLVLHVSDVRKRRALAASASVPSHSTRPTIVSAASKSLVPQPTRVPLAE